MQRFLFPALLAGALLGTGCGTAQKATAETKPAVENRQGPSARLEAEIAELELSDAQAETYREINENYGKQLRELRRGTDGDRQKMAAAGGKLRAAQEREVFDLLTDPQREKYNAIKDRYKAAMRNRQRVERPGGGGE
jgi:hypothetical protein